MTAIEAKLDRTIGQKKGYQSPELRLLGSVVELTQGNGGTSVDGGGARTQQGGGNDGQRKR